MLKYLYAKQVFKEIPDEITLAVAISGCKIRCPGCHSKELWEDVGTLLTVKELKKLIDSNEGITCICFMGGEHDMQGLLDLMKSVPLCLKIAWYCGLEKVPLNSEVYKYLDFIKLGPYKEELGGLDNPNTNQRLYKVHYFDLYSNKGFELIDITSKLQ